MKKIMKNSRNGFTLVEIMVVMAIIAILAAVTLVSYSGWAARARSSKAQTQLASAIPNMIACWGNGGKVNKPDSDGGGDICSLTSSYGQWPNFISDMATYDYVSSTAAMGDPDYCMTGCIDRDSWFVYINSPLANDNRRICCNKAANGCASSVKTAGTACNSASWID